jgi:hypothetical protein
MHADDVTKLAEAVSLRVCRWKLAGALVVVCTWQVQRYSLNMHFDSCIACTLSTVHIVQSGRISLSLDRQLCDAHNFQPPLRLDYIGISRLMPNYACLFSGQGHWSKLIPSFWMISSVDCSDATVPLSMHACIWLLDPTTRSHRPFSW